MYTKELSKENLWCKEGGQRCESQTGGRRCGCLRGEIQRLVLGLTLQFQGVVDCVR